MDKSRGAVALQMPYLRVVDLQEESEAHANDTFSNAGTALQLTRICQTTVCDIRFVLVGSAWLDTGLYLMNDEEDMLARPGIHCMLL
jgi:hypothetical protein